MNGNNKNLRLLSLVPAIMGIAAGAVTSLILARSVPPEQDSRAPGDKRSQEVTPSVDHAVNADDGYEMRFRQLERQIANTGTVDPTSGPVPPAVGFSAESMEKNKREHLALHEAAIQSHLQDGHDPRWSRDANAKIEATLQKVNSEGAHVSVEDVDCRMTSCLAKLTWPDYKTAVQEYFAVLHNPVGMNCSIEMSLPPPEKLESSYATTAVYDCHQERTLQAQ